LLVASNSLPLDTGSLKTPQLLELSGVGNPTLLKSLGIPVVVNASGVGENLMDHPISTSDFIVKDGVLTLGTLHTLKVPETFKANLYTRQASQQRQLRRGTSLAIVS
jgi:choline dehydrogenase-like flavoprotein